MLGLGHDTRFAFRQLARHRSSTAVAVLSLGIGVGVNTAVFCLVNALLLRPLPVHEPSRLLDVGAALGDAPGVFALSYPNFRDLRETMVPSPFAAVAAHTNVTLAVSTSRDGEPEKMRGQVVSAGFFELLGVAAALGRTFSVEESTVEGAHPVAVLGHHFWRARLAGDSAVVGREVAINGRAFTVVGVAPEGFYGVRSTHPTDVFVADAMWRHVLPASVRDGFERRSYGAFAVVARLGPGVSEALARAGLDATAERLRATHPADNQRLGLVARSLDEARIGAKQRGELTLGAKLLLVGAGILLLITCVNLSTLMLERLVARRPEIALRVTLGARHADLLRLLLTESLLLAAAGGGVGLILAIWLRGLAWSLRPARLPGELDLGYDFRVVLFAAGLVALVTLLVGIAPALQVRGRHLAPMGRGEPPRPGWRRLGRLWSARDLLVTLQAALSLLSLVGALVFLERVLESRELDLGFERERLLVVALDPSAAGYDEARGLELYDRLTERVEQLPAVTSAAIGEIVNLHPVGFLMSMLHAEGASPDDLHLTQVNTIAPGYFATLGIPLLAGRDLAKSDRDDAPSAVVVNESLARRHWSGESALGRRLTVVGTGEVYNVVGIARDARYKTVDEEPYPYLYRTLAQHYTSPVYLHVRTSGSPTAVASSVRATIRAVEPRLALTDVWTMDEVLERSLWAPRMAMALLSVFGVLGLLLALLGLHGAVTSSVRQRRREIALRTALGAQHADLRRMIVREGMTVVACGLAIGLLATIAAAYFVSSHLGGMSPATTGRSLAAASTLLVATAWAASAMAAWRAGAVEPAPTLRGD